MNLKLIAASLLVLSAPAAEAALIAAWSLDEASGNLIDLTGNHAAGIPTGTPDYGQPGVPNGTYGAVQVEGAVGASIGLGPSTVDEYFTVGTSNNNPVSNIDATGSFTVMGWINPATPAAATTYRLISTGSAGGADRGWGFGLRLNNVDGTGSAIRFTSYGILDANSATFDLTFGGWIHIAATYNNGTVGYYLNGESLTGVNTTFGNDLEAARLTIGGRLGGADGDQVNGLLDGILVFDEVLDAAAIRQAAALSVVPEPSSVALLALAGLAWRRRRS